MSRHKPSARLKKPGTYDVGYGKPPTTHQFKPGKSGNPRGRPKGSRNVVTEITDVFFSTVTLTLPNGKQEKMPLWKAALWKQGVKAAQGDFRSFLTMMKMVDRYDILPMELADDAEEVSPPDMAALDDLFARMAEGKGIDLKMLAPPPAAIDAEGTSSTTVRRVDFSLMDKEEYQAFRAASRSRRGGGV